jgi:phospholipid/cholesterol/gamma-HCH transport system substrate-binding protein
MSEKVSYIVVGVFVLLLGGAGVTTILWMTQATGGKEYNLYQAYMYESVSGLNVGAEVSYRGVRVGQVRAIMLDRESPERVRLLLEIEDGTPVKTDTVAVLVTQGITGVANVELQGGSRDAPLLRTEPGRRYPEIPTAPSLFVRLDTAVTNLVTQLTATTENLNRVTERIRALLTDENLADISATLDHVQSISASVETVADSLASRSSSLEHSIDDVRVILDNAAQASAEVPSLVTQADHAVAALTETATNFGNAAAGLGEVSDTFNRAVDNSNELINRVREAVDAITRDTPAQVADLVVEMRLLTNAMRRLAEDLNTTPEMLLFGRPQSPPGPGEE